MLLDIAFYEINKEFVQRWYIEQSNGDFGYAISLLASCTSVPAIAIAYWIGEVEGWTPELMRSIQSFKDFYGYTEIRNKPPGAPF